MKLILFLCLMLGVTSYSFSQIHTKMMLCSDKSISSEIFGSDSNQFFHFLNFSLGARFEKQWGSTEINAVYMVSHSGDDDVSIFQSHFVGGEVKYVFLNKESRFRPFIKFGLFTEVATNYKDGFLTLYSFRATNKPTHSDYYGYYQSNFYDATPLVSSLFVGMEVKLSKNINVLLAFGYGKRKILYRSEGWYPAYYQDVMDNLHEVEKEAKSFRMFRAQIGLNYSINFKKQ